MFGGYLTYRDFFSFKITLPPTRLTTQTTTVATFGKLECGRYDLNKIYNYSTMLNISHDMAARKLVKFNNGLSQIFIKVPLSKNMKLELIKYFRAFTPRSTN